MSTDDSIIIKHAKDYLASNTSFKLDITRCVSTILWNIMDFGHILISSQDHETAILRALDSLPPYSKDDIMVKTPRLFYFDQESHTQVLEDLPNSLDLKTFLISESNSLSKSSGLSIGRALGSWLRSLHNWATENEQAALTGILRQNKSMQQIKFYANYTLLVESIENFPTLLEGSRSVFNQVRDLAAAELEEQGHSDEYGIIQGDFWTGKYVDAEPFSFPPPFFFSLCAQMSEY